MINCSVPGYATILRMIGQIAEGYARPNTYCYDQDAHGAATWPCATVLIPAARRLWRWIIPSAMIEKARQVIAADAGEVPVTLQRANLQDAHYQRLSGGVEFHAAIYSRCRTAGYFAAYCPGFNSRRVLILSENSPLTMRNTKH